MGTLAIAPSDTMQVWAGTGEPNSRNSIEPGAGIYKSTDGGITWTLMGLEKTQHIGRIVVHPRNPNIVYVAALGAAWTTNPERGLYKTDDGGTTWKLVKFISDKAGFIDVALDPSNPDVVWATSWERIRTPVLPQVGRPGLGALEVDRRRRDVDGDQGQRLARDAEGTHQPRHLPRQPEDRLRDGRGGLGAEPEALGQPPQQLKNGLYRSTDGGATWTKMNNTNMRPFYYSQVRVDPRNPDRVYFSSTPMLVSNDGGKTAREAARDVHIDTHALWIDPNDPEHMVIGNDGGMYITYDKGGNLGLRCKPARSGSSTK